MNSSPVIDAGSIGLSLRVTNVTSMYCFAFSESAVTVAPLPGFVSVAVAPSTGNLPSGVFVISVKISVSAKLPMFPLSAHACCWKFTATSPSCGKLPVKL